jgi:hypothetical protein
MERDTIIRLAREAGLWPTEEWSKEYGIPTPNEQWLPELERFAALVAAAECERNDAYIKSLHESVSWQAERVIACLKALEKAVLAEREACAKVCDEHAKRNYNWASENADIYHAQAHWAGRIAAAIRARGQE